jgi:hypothetical protein
MLAAYQNVASSAQNFYNTTTPQNYSNNPNDFVAPLNATQMAGMGNINAATGQAQPFYQQATNTLQGAQSATSPYYNAATQSLQQGQYGGLAGTQQAFNTLGGANAAAAPYQQAGAYNMGQAYANAQPYNIASAQNVQAGQDVGAGLGAASLDTLGQAQQQGQGYTQSAYQQAQPYNQAAGAAYAAGLGAAQPFQQQAAQGFNQAGMGVNQAYQNAQPYNAMAADFGLAGAGPVNAQQIGGQQIGQFMSPYIQSVLQGTEGMLNQQNQQAMSGQLGNAIQSGAFGGDRAGIAAANLAQQQQLANAQTYSGILNQGYGQALGAAQQQQGVNLGASQANRAALQNASNQMLGIGQQGYSQGLGAAQQQASLAQQRAALGQQLFGQGQATGQNIAGLGQQIYGQGTGVGQQLFGQGSTAAQQQAALGQQLFGQNLTAAQQQAALGQQQYGQGMGLGAAQVGLGQQLFGQGATTAEQQAALAQQQYAQGQGAAQGYQNIGQGIYNTGSQTAQQLAALGQGAQGASLQGAQAQMAAGQTQQQTQQAALQALYNQWYQTQYGLPMQLLNTYAGAIEGIGQNAGSTTHTTQPGGLFAAGGAVRQERYAGGPVNSQGGAVGLAGAGQGFADGGMPSYDPSAMKEMLAEQRGMYAGQGQAGPAAPPNFAAQTFTSPQPGPAGRAPGHTETPQQKPSQLEQATNNIATAGMQQGEMMAGKAGLKAMGFGPPNPWAAAASKAAAAGAGSPAAAAGAISPDMVLGQSGIGAAAPAHAAGGLGGLGAGIGHAASAVGSGLTSAAGTLGSAAAGAAGAVGSGLAAAGSAAMSALPMLAAFFNTGGRVGRADGGPVGPEPDRIIDWDGLAGGLKGAADFGNKIANPALNLANVGWDRLTHPLTPEQQAAQGVGPAAASAAFQHNMGGLGAAVRQNLGAAQQHGATGSWTPSTPPAAAPVPVRHNLGHRHVPDPTDPAARNFVGNYDQVAPKLPDDTSAGLAGARAHADSSAAAASAASAAAQTGADPMQSRLLAKQAATEAAKAEQKSAAPTPPAPAPAAAPAASAAAPTAPATPPAQAVAPVQPAPQPGMHTGLGAGVDSIANGAANFGGDLMHGLGAGLKGYGSQLREGDPNAWIPLMKGIQAMAAAPTRNFGVGLAQGVGAGAGAYYDTQKQQAEIAKTKAETNLTNQIGLRNFVSASAAMLEYARQGLDINPDPNGPIHTPEGNFSIRGTKPMLAGARAENGLVAGTPTKYIGSEGKKVADNAITDYGAQIKNDPSYASNNNKLIDDIYHDQSLAANGKTQINKYATTFTGTNPNDALAPGAIAPMVAPYAALYNSLYDKLGFQNFGLQKIDPTGLTNAELLEKMSNQLALADQAGAHDPTLGALQAALKTKPGVGMDRNAGISLLADTYIANRRSDELGDYVQEVDSLTGLPSRNFDAAATQRAFAKDHNPYDRDRHALTVLLADPRYRQAMQNLSTYAPGTPQYEKTKQWLDEYGKDKTFHQYFVKE